MRVVRALFWIIAVSLLLAGGNGFANYYEGKPGAAYVAEGSPAHASAERIVASLARLDGWCAEHEVVCGTAGQIGSYAVEAVDFVMQALLGKDGAQVAQGDKANPESVTAGSEGIQAAPSKAAFDGFQDLYYDEGEELEDIG